MTIAFKKAEKSNSYLKIAVTGPSGSGKTHGGLGLATCFGKKIAVIDSENGSASLYSDKFEFDVLNIEPPYEVNKFIQAIEAAVAAGYEVLVIDSLTHVWAGSGGLLDKKSALDSSGKGNSYTNWASITKDHERLLASLLHSKIHLVATMRSKQAHSMEDGASGKKVIKKVGMEPIQRDGIEYEFTTVFDLSMDHFAQVSKDRTDLFDGQVFKLDRRIGASLLNWLKNPKQEDKKNELIGNIETSTDNATIRTVGINQMVSGTQLSSDGPTIEKQKNQVQTKKEPEKSQVAEVRKKEGGSAPMKLEDWVQAWEKLPVPSRSKKLAETPNTKLQGMAAECIKKNIGHEFIKAVESYLG